METNITTVKKNGGKKSAKKILIFHQATPPHWGDGEPPSPIEFYDTTSFCGKTLHDKLDCPCGGGMSCIVDRRCLGDWVMEDEVFRKAKCKLRLNCFEPMSDLQLKLLREAWKKS
mgnify:CR=1 FL=1